MKLPYLVFDLATARMLTMIPKGRNEQVAAFKFWMINPISIYTTYVYARYDIIALFLIVVCIYVARNRVSGMLILLAATVLRLFPGLLIIPYALTVEGCRRDRIRLILLGTVPFVALVQALNALGLLTFTSSILGFWIQWVVGPELPTGPQFLVGGTLAGEAVFLLPFLYTLWLAVLVLFPGRDRERLPLAFLSTVSLYLTVGFLHPQYFSWITPFVALNLSRRFVRLAHAGQIATFPVLTMYWGKWATSYLFAALNPAMFITLPTATEIISNFLPAPLVLNIFRSIFSGFSAIIPIFVIALLIQSRVNTF